MPAAPSGKPSRRNKRSKASLEVVAVSHGAAASAIDLKDPSLYVNRELSLLAFQRRVLEEAEDESNPLLERIKFLAIVSSNLDEFFMVRVAGLKQQLDAGILDYGPDGMLPAAQLEAIRDEVQTIMEEVRNHLQRKLLPALEEEGIRIASYQDLDPKQRERVNRYFSDVVFPVLTPLAFDPGRPFPHISNLSLNLAVLLRDSAGVEHFARVKVPDTLLQLVPADQPAVLAPGRRPKQRRDHTFVWLEQLISNNLDMLFPGMEILQAHAFHVVRDAEMAIQELEADDLLEVIEEGVRQRRFGSVVRLAVTKDIPSEALEILMHNLEVERQDVYRVKSILALSRLMHLYNVDRPDLKYSTFLAATPVPADQKEEDDIFAAIRREDILLHHPFDSFQPVVDFLQKAARDPDVLAIKITLYRVGRNSPVVKTLLDAMAHGKQVAALVELKARFDEESNIEWARALESEGVHVVYGLVGLKIHSKVALVVRREGKAIRRYVHVATGNYNTVTAHMYTDLGLLTCNEEMGADATDLFNYLTGYSAKTDYRKLVVSPINLRPNVQQLIQREIEHQKAGRGGHLIFKFNSLADSRMIRLLYEASQAGVKIDLLVRGICCLRPGIPGVSENIQVRSVVGRFLEHSRIYYFRNGGDEQIYIGSADLMTRNIDRRVEALAPVTHPPLLRYLLDDVLASYLIDNVKARIMDSEGKYSKVPIPKDASLRNTQEWLIQRHSRRRLS